MKYLDFLRISGLQKSESAEISWHVGDFRKAVEILRNLYEIKSKNFIESTEAMKTGNSKICVYEGMIKVIILKKTYSRQFILQVCIASGIIIVANMV